MDSMPANVIPHRGFAKHAAIPCMGLGYWQDSPMRPRDVLADNLKKLMAATPSLSTFPQITQAGGGANGTLDRIRRKAMQTGIDNLEPLARAYGIEAWQLLVPTLEASKGDASRPVVTGMPDWPFHRVSIDRFLHLEPEDRAYVEGALDAAISRCEAAQEDALVRHSIPRPAQPKAPAKRKPKH